MGFKISLSNLKFLSWILILLLGPLEGISEGQIRKSSERNRRKGGSHCTTKFGPSASEKQQTAQLQFVKNQLNMIRASGHSKFGLWPRERLLAAEERIRLKLLEALPHLVFEDRTKITEARRILTDVTLEATELGFLILYSPFQVPARLRPGASQTQFLKAIHKEDVYAAFGFHGTLILVTYQNNLIAPSFSEDLQTKAFFFEAMTNFEELFHLLQSLNQYLNFAPTGALSQLLRSPKTRPAFEADSLRRNQINAVGNQPIFDYEAEADFYAFLIENLDSVPEFQINYNGYPSRQLVEQILNK